MAYSMIRQKWVLLVVLLGSGLITFYVSCSPNGDIVNSSSLSQNKDIVNSSSPSPNGDVVNSSSPSPNGDIVNSGSPSASALQVGICNSSFALCMSDGRKIYVVDDLLYGMALKFSDSGVGSSGFSSDGYIHVKVSHPTNAQYNFLKITYDSDGGLVALKDDGKTLYNWICNNPMTDNLVTASCGSPLRVFDVASGKKTQIVEVGSGSSASAWTALVPAWMMSVPRTEDPNFRFRFELLGYADYQFDTHNVLCSCQFTGDHVNRLISQGIFQITSSTEVRLGASTRCSSNQLIYLNGLPDLTNCKCLVLRD